MHSLDTQQADAAADVCDLNRVTVSWLWVSWLGVTHHATLIAELRAITNVSLAFAVNPTRSPPSAGTVTLSEFISDASEMSHRHIIPWVSADMAYLTMRV